MWKHLSIILCLGLVVTARRVEQGDLEPYEEDVRAIRLTEESENIGQLSEREQELESLENKMEMLGGRVDQATEVCALPEDSGPCTGLFRKWRYDKGSGICKAFTYGGCLGNKNNFDSREECERFCNRDAVCREFIAPDKPCKAYILRWRFVPRIGRCVNFMYGGCGGNANNFETYKACEMKCHLESKRVVKPMDEAIDRKRATFWMGICALPEDGGNCHGIIRRWRYDKGNGMCKVFTYGGCGGNKNNFDTEEECERFCNRDKICEMPPVRGPCRASIPRIFFDYNAGVCQVFTYGGCGGNANNFRTVEACEKKCIESNRVVKPMDEAIDRKRAIALIGICALPEDSGPCLGFFRRWHYDKISGTCKEFTYGGCGGNKNNFDTEEECERFCNRDKICRMPPVTGPCKAGIPRIFFDYNAGVCREFTYGGCFGNANNFGTVEACERKCIESNRVVKPMDEAMEGKRAMALMGICAMPSRKGRCKMHIPSYYYDHSTGECRQFIYGGCGGNDNRFSTQEECEDKCSPQEICRMPQSSGSCKAYLPRFFFDYSAGICRQFVNGGCEGNANNFATIEACERTCSLYMKRVAKQIDEMEEYHDGTKMEEPEGKIHERTSDPCPACPRIICPVCPKPTGFKTYQNPFGSVNLSGGAICPACPTIICPVCPKPTGFKIYDPSSTENPSEVHLLGGENTEGENPNTSNPDNEIPPPGPERRKYLRELEDFLLDKLAEEEEEEMTEDHKRVLKRNYRK